MPIRTWIERERRRARAEIVGDFTMDDIVGVIEALAADPDFGPSFGILTDHTRIGEPITSDQLHRMTALFAEHASRFAGCRWAVVTAKPASYGMMRMLSVFAEQIPMVVRPFSTFEEAEAWLAGPTDAGPPREDGGR